MPAVRRSRPVLACRRTPATRIRSQSRPSSPPPEARSRTQRLGVLPGLEVDLRGIRRWSGLPGTGCSSDRGDLLWAACRRFPPGARPNWKWSAGAQYRKSISARRVAHSGIRTFPDPRQDDVWRSAGAGQSFSTVRGDRLLHACECAPDLGEPDKDSVALEWTNLTNKYYTSRQVRSTGGGRRPR